MRRSVHGRLRYSDVPVMISNERVIAKSAVLGKLSNKAISRRSEAPKDFSRETPITVFLCLALLLSLLSHTIDVVLLATDC